MTTNLLQLSLDQLTLLQKARSVTAPVRYYNKTIFMTRLCIGVGLKENVNLYEEGCEELWSDASKENTLYHMLEIVLCLLF